MSYLSKAQHIITRDKIVELSIGFALQTNPNPKKMREELKPLLDELEEWYIYNRPLNEVEMTKQSWKSIWYDDADIGDRGPIRLNKQKIWQVIGEDSYYNVSENSLGGCCRFTNYLQGKYTINNKPFTPENVSKRLNTIDLEFVYNGIRRNELVSGANVNELVDNVEKKKNRLFSKNAIRIPGPIGVKGRLWNLYLDDKYRFAYGIDLKNPKTIDIYILEKNNIVS